MYYDKSQLLSYNKLFSFVIGARGIGKTYQFKLWSISDYLRNGNKAWWVMRYKTELDKVTKDGRFFADIAERFPEYGFEIDGSVGYITRTPGIKSPVWEPFISFQALSESAIKAISDPLCTKIVFDEFIPLPGIRYLNNEVERFLEFYFTISRGRDVRAFFLANNVTVASPYFTYFKIRPGSRQFTVGDEIVIENARTEQFTEAMQSTRFGRLVSGTHYSEYAINNESLADTDAFISDKIPPRSRELFNLKTGYGVFQILICQPASLYVRKRKNSANAETVVYAVDMALHDEDTMAVTVHYQMVRNILTRYYAEGLMCFDSQETKAEFLQSCWKLLVKT